MKLEKARALIDALKTIASEVGTLTTTIRTRKDDDGKIFSLAAPATQDEPVHELFARFRMISALGRTLRADSVARLASDEELETLTSDANGICSALKSLNQILLEHQKYKIPNSKKWIIQDSATNSLIDLRPVFADARKRSESILKNASFFLRYKRSKDDGALVALHAELSELISSIVAEFERVSQNSSESGKLTDAQANALAKAHDTLQELERLQGQATTERKNIQEYASEGANHLTNIREMAAGAKKLESRVSDYSNQFEQLQKEMDARREEIQAGRRDVEKLVTDVAGWTAAIEELKHRGEEMLSLTTTAGLAANYSSIVSSLTKELKHATLGFYVGIVVLIASATPLFAHAVLPLAALFDDGLREYAKAIAHPAGSSPLEYIAQAFGRMIILVPAAWLVSFSARRHSALFKLREHYEYKYSLAASVEGFKKEASKYGDEIAATVFQELAFNPADKLDHKDTENHKPPHAILAKALSLISGEKERGSAEA